MSTPVSYDSVKFLKEQIDKSPEDSKKWKLINRGMLCLILIFGVSLAATFVKPEISGQVAGLAQAVIVALGGLVAVGCGSIAAVDYRNTSALEKVATSPQFSAPPPPVTSKVDNPDS